MRLMTAANTHLPSAPMRRDERNMMGHGLILHGSLWITSDTASHRAIVTKALTPPCTMVAREFPHHGRSRRRLDLQQYGATGYELTVAGQENSHRSASWLTTILTTTHSDTGGHKTTSQRAKVAKIRRRWTHTNSSGRNEANSKTAGCGFDSCPICPRVPHFEVCRAIILERAKELHSYFSYRVIA
jgi:hypothetical protein